MSTVPIRSGGACARPCNGQNLVRVPGALRQVDADDHEVWGVNAAHNIIYKRPVDGSGSWTQFKLLEV